MRDIFVLACLCTFALTSSLTAQERKTRDELVLEDLANVVASDFWIYNDLPQGIARAQQSGQPLLVVFRCIPCDACAQLDSDIVERDPLVRRLLDKFVCVRIVHANGMDLSLFQYDYDQSFAAFFMNADKTIYGRYGTRSHQTESEDDVALEGFAAALRAALEIHAAYPGNKATLAGKQSQDVPAYPVPEEYPSLKDQYDADLKYEGGVARSCIHCHQVGEVQRSTFRDSRQKIPEKVLFPYPHPKSLGLIMDPRETATVKEVVPDSPAATAGFRGGDAILSLAGQPLLSIADIQWVLHNAPAEGEIEAQVTRDGSQIALALPLNSGWRQLDNLSWRATSWALRRMTTGGLLLEDASEEQRRRAGLAESSLGLSVRHVGQYGPHALAKQAGFQQGDVITSIDGRSEAMRETDLFALLVNDKAIGEEVSFKVWRDGRQLDLTLRMQE